MECERRFLVDPASDWRRQVKPYRKLLQDRYLACGRLRLRRQQDSETGRVVFKLTKKYEGGSASAQPIVTIYLTRSEFDGLSELPGHPLTKTRHYFEDHARTFAVDLFQDDLDGLVLCELETEECDAQFPDFAAWDVSEDRFFTGGSLCRASRSDLEGAIARVLAVSQSSRTLELND